MYRRAADSPGHRGPSRTNSGSPSAALMLLPSPPGRLGFGGIESLSLLGAKAKDLGPGGLLDQGEEEAQACHLCTAPCGPFPRAAPFPPRGHSLVFREDGLAVRLNFLPVCIFVSVWTKPSINHPSCNALPSPLPSASFPGTRTPAASALSLAQPDLRASCAQAIIHARPRWAPLWAVWGGCQQQLCSLAPSPTALSGFLC